MEETEVQTLIIKQSRKALVVELLVLCIPFVIAYILVNLLISSFLPFANSVLVNFILFAVLVVFVVAAVLVQNKRWNSRQYIINPANISIKESVFGDDCVSYNTKGIIAINAHQSVFTKWLGYGDITLHFMGGSDACLRNVPNPNQYIDKMREIVMAKKTVDSSTDQIS